MIDTTAFALLILLAALVVIGAVLSNRVFVRLPVPAPALFLGAAALAAAISPRVHSLPQVAVERLVTVALIVILFDGGMHLGRRRFRAAIGPILSLGILGTFLTAAAATCVGHFVFGLDWYVALLLGTAVAPTDPAVVFSVLGKREMTGRSSAILEGESGANDPVGIALLASLLAAGSLNGQALVHAAGEFGLQMAVGALSGVLGGRALLWFVRRVELPSEGLYPLRSVACVMALYGATTLAHGSGFLAVFVAGIVIGDERAPFKREVERFHSALASLGEIVAFVVLGLTVNLAELTDPAVWLPGLCLAVALGLLIRPVLGGLCLLPSRLQRSERAFVLFGGLKGAVPILLGSLLLAAGVPGAQRLYGIVVIVVAFSVVVQGTLVPGVASALHLDMQVAELQPWSIGLRLVEEPEGVLLLTVTAGSGAEGMTVDDLADSVTERVDPGGIWVSMIARGGRLVPVRGGTRLQAGDEVLVTADEHLHARLTEKFLA